LNSISGRLKHAWNWLIGSTQEFTIPNIAFNAIIIVTAIILLVFLPFNAYIGLGKIVMLLTGLMVMLGIFYYFSRFRKRYTIGLALYAMLSYFTLVFTFLYNSGSYGPIIFIFFLTFQLLIAFTRRQLHLLWFIAHLLVPLCLLLTEYYRPGWIPQTYTSREARFSDLLSSYIVVLVCMYWITAYLRNNYLIEKRKAAARLEEIEQQNKKILAQNETLEQLNEQKIKLFSIISHDLRAPMVTAKGLAELLKDDVLEGEEKKIFQNELYHISAHALDMITNLLAWSSAQMQGVTARITPVNMMQLTEKVIATQTSGAEKKQIQIVNTMNHQQPVPADADLMELIVRNIIHNAVKFTPQAGNIHIADKAVGGIYEISIRDTGVGMTPEQMMALFSVQTTSTYGTHNEKGTGLGLRLCRDFMELQGGQIRVDSTPGEGSTFYLSLPL
jgi:signal transduction histidine kinase